MVARAPLLRGQASTELVVCAEGLPQACRTGIAGSEDGAGRLALPRGLSGIALVIGDQFAPRPAGGRNSQLIADLTQQAVSARHVSIGLHADRR